MSSYHTPVLVEEVVKNINLRPNGIYVDCTVGGGGHSLAMLAHTPSIKLFCFDQDDDAIRQAKKTLLGSKVVFFKDNFKNFRTQLALEKINKVDGILMDIGVSNHQLSEAKRGFSFMMDSPLDMRMDKRQETSAYDIINTYSSENLSRIFFEYGEERYSKKIAANIVKHREIDAIRTTKELSNIIEKSMIYHNDKTVKSKARIFQAIRIEVNKELEVLKIGLKDAVKALKPNGRIVVISWHSLEDRIVKETFVEETHKCSCPAELPVCKCENKAKLRIITKKPITPTEKEIVANSNARSAKLRVGEKV